MNRLSSPHFILTSLHLLWEVSPYSSTISPKTGQSAWLGWWTGIWHGLGALSTDMILTTVQNMISSPLLSSCSQIPQRRVSLSQPSLSEVPRPRLLGLLTCTLIPCMKASCLRHVGGPGLWCSSISLPLLLPTSPGTVPKSTAPILPRRREVWSVSQGFTILLPWVQPLSICSNTLMTGRVGWKMPFPKRYTS